MNPNRADRFLRRLYPLALLVALFTGFGNMPVYKRYYVSAVPGLGWSSNFYVNIYIHYIAGGVLLAIAAYFLVVYLKMRLDNGRLTITGDATQLVLDGLRLESDAADRINARGRMLESRIGADTHVAVADYRIHLEPTARTETGSINGEVVLSGGRISGSQFSADDITAAIRLVYRPDRNEITLPEMNLVGHLSPPLIATVGVRPTKRLSLEGRGV